MHAAGRRGPQRFHVGGRCHLDLALDRRRRFDELGHRLLAARAHDDARARDSNRPCLSPPPPSLVLAWQVSGAKGTIQAGPLGKLASQVEALDRKVEETKGKISGRVADAKGKAGEATGKLASPFDNLARQIEETKERLKGGS